MITQTSSPQGHVVRDRDVEKGFVFLCFHTHMLPEAASSPGHHTNSYKTYLEYYRGCRVGFENLSSTIQKIISWYLREQVLVQTQTLHARSSLKCPQSSQTDRHCHSAAVWGALQCLSAPTRALGIILLPSFLVWDGELSVSWVGKAELNPAMFLVTFEKLTCRPRSPQLCHLAPLFTVWCQSPCQGTPTGSPEWKGVVMT